MGALGAVIILFIISFLFLYINVSTNLIKMAKIITGRRAV